MGVTCAAHWIRFCLCTSFLGDVSLEDVPATAFADDGTTRQVFPSQLSQPELTCRKPWR